jgi:hypothetical protein
MLVHPLGGRAATARSVKKELAKGPDHIRRLYLDRLFPHGPEGLKQKSLTLAFYAVFLRASEELSPSVAYYDPRTCFLITDKKRLKDLPERTASKFFPVIVLESRSHRARFWVDERGKVIEFKGLTPKKYDEDRVNINSGQPEGLLALSAAQAEGQGLKVIGELDSKVTRLVRYFPDMKNYAQLVRRGKNGGRYLPWLRMDIPRTVMEAVAGLQGIPLEQYLYESGERLGRQLRSFHQSGKTLHAPYPEATKHIEPFFSSMHSGNVVVGGHLIDLEGAMTFAEARSEFVSRAEADEKNFRAIPRPVLKAMKKRRFSFFSRMSDLQRLIGGRASGESSLFGSLYYKERRKNVDLFMRVLAGIIDGYYVGATGDKKTSRELASLKKSILKESPHRWSFLLTCRLFSTIEDRLRALRASQ